MEAEEGGGTVGGEHERAKNQVSRHVPFGDLRCPDTAGPSQSPEDEAAVLWRVVAAGVITTDEAELIGRTRLNRLSLAGVAAATGEPPWALQRRRHTRRNAPPRRRRAPQIPANPAQLRPAGRLTVDTRHPQNRRQT